MKSLAIFGASGHGKVVADAAESSGWSRIVFFDDFKKDSHKHWPIAGNFESLCNEISTYDGIIIAIGNNSIRNQKMVLLEKFKSIFATIVHPSAVVSRYAQVGAGTVILGGAVINTDAKIGCGVIINTSATVDHDCDINDYAHISPGAHLAGDVHIGFRTWLGIGACVKQAITIGNDVVVGAGAVVLKNVPDDKVAVGIPARLLR